MGYGFYIAALAAVTPAAFLALGWRLVTRPEYRPHLAERFGDVAASPSNKRVIWLHAVSVGEVISAVPLVKALRNNYPDAHLVVSCGTPTGRATAEERLSDTADRIVYLAYDFPHMIGPMVRRIRPDLVLVVETEIWPNLLAQLSRRKVPVLLVNGRISTTSYPRYRLFSGLIGRALSGVRCLMQSERDALFIRDLGAPAEQVEVSGNIKYDQDFAAPDAATLAGYRQALGIEPGVPVLLAGSTHEGEETALAGAFCNIRKAVPDLALVIAVRHPNRVDEVAGALTAMGLSVGRKSLGDGAGSDVVLLDTVGELAAHYALADVAFVGGSLTPVGGHNPLEPAAAGVPVVYGPHVHNFEEPCRALETAGAALRLKDGEDITRCLLELFADADRRAAMGSAGRATVAANRGALERTLTRVREVLSR
ncbi:MAG: 3-deoxy-D-manno-octulosonic acid transferase [Leptospirillia bacterium]